MKTTRKESPNSYIANRDNTAGPNNDNPGLKDLDKNYASHPNRQGSNAHKHDFDNGERVKSTPMYDNDKAQTREDKSTPGTLKAVKPFDPKRGGV